MILIIYQSYLIGYTYKRSCITELKFSIINFI